MRVARVLSFGALTSCALFVDLDGLSTGAPGAPPVEEAGSADAGTDVATSVEASVDAGEETDAAPDFVDTFDRPDAATLDNGWTEKNPGAFSIAGGEVHKGTASEATSANVVYRPVLEDRQDVEVSMELRPSAPPGFAQVFARGQRSSITITGNCDAYVMYVNNSLTGAFIGRRRGGGGVTTLAPVTFVSGGLSTNATQRLRLSVRGTNPVLVNGAIERFGDNAWTVIASGEAQDASVNRIEASGTTGFSSGDVGDAVFDVFTWRSLSP